MLNPVFAALIAMLAVHKGVWMIRKGRGDVRMMLQIFLECRVLAQVTRIINQRRIVAQRLRYFGMPIEVVVEMLYVRMVLTVFGGRRGIVRMRALCKSRGDQRSGEQGRRNERHEAFHGSRFLLLNGTWRSPQGFTRGLACSLH